MVSGWDQNFYSSGDAAYSVKSDGAEEMLVYNFIWNAVWSPNGEEIAGTLGVRSGNSGQFIFLQNTLTGQGSVLANESMAIDWR